MADLMEASSVASDWEAANLADLTVASSADLDSAATSLADLTVASLADLDSVATSLADLVSLVAAFIKEAWYEERKYQLTLINDCASTYNVIGCNKLLKGVCHEIFDLQFFL